MEAKTALFEVGDHLVEVAAGLRGRAAEHGNVVDIGDTQDGLGGQGRHHLAVLDVPVPRDAADLERAGADSLRETQGPRPPHWKDGQTRKNNGVRANELSSEVVKPEVCGRDSWKAEIFIQALWNSNAVEKQSLTSAELIWRSPSTSSRAAKAAAEGRGEAAGGRKYVLVKRVSNMSL